MICVVSEKKLQVFVDGGMDNALSHKLPGTTFQIPNFLHLTPPAIKKHCAALKQFCTKWPEELDTDEKCEVHFPIEVQISDYISAGPSIRNPKSRVVTLNIRLSSLNLDDHARKKLIWLVGHRYCKQTDILTIKTDRCPLRKQNYDYTFYLLTVLYHESWKVEPWEASKSREDMEIYKWDGSPSEATLNEIMVNIRQAEHKPAPTVDELRTSEEIKSYSESVEMLKNVGETDQNMHNYKEAVLRLFRLQHAA
uniref:Mitochondrial ribosomal protein S35 n=1 Tax=Eptatretus burgeri TaxID=7764 RepID=A0A8C4Q6P2_EPTBU